MSVGGCSVVEASKTDNSSTLFTLGSIFSKSISLARCGHGLRLEYILLTTARSRTAISTVVIGSCPHYLWQCFPAESQPNVSSENDAMLDFWLSKKQTLNRPHVITLNWFSIQIFLLNQCQHIWLTETGYAVSSSHHYYNASLCPVECTFCGADRPMRWEIWKDMFSELAVEAKSCVFELSRNDRLCLPAYINNLLFFLFIHYVSISLRLCSYSQTGHQEYRKESQWAGRSVGRLRNLLYKNKSQRAASSVGPLW